MKSILLVVSTALLIDVAVPAYAWGPEGHAIVADIAEAHLSRTALSQVSQLLAQEGHTHLDEISSWADEVRPQRRETAPWHFVDIPLGASGYDAGRDCAGGNCVVAKIGDFEKVLANRSAAPADRLDALKWVVHLVGDVHQPLHAEDDGDRGGNELHLSYFKKRTNLHAIWDGGILEAALGLRLGPHYTFDHAAVESAAMKLDGGIRSADRAMWAPAGLDSHIDQAVVSWANESHGLAKTVAYPDLPSTRRGDWSTAYEEQAWPVVMSQLERAGVRLAEVLNEALR